YHYDYNIGNINSSKLAKLCTWPSDIDIATTIKHSYKLASELAKALDMNSTSSTNNSLLLPFVMIETPDLEISTGIKSNSEFENDLNKFFEIDKEISDAISQAFKYTTEAINNIFDSLNIKDTDDQIYQTQIISILNNSTRIFNNEQVEHKELDYSNMIALRRCHEAYNLKPIEKQNCTHLIGYEKSRTINLNKASHLISQLINNTDPAMRFIKQREKRWKENWKTMTTNLASLQQSELSKQR
ncbi:10890_t:CDS:2, partial [Racocetra fulgida]